MGIKSRERYKVWQSSSFILLLVWGSFFSYDYLLLLSVSNGNQWLVSLSNRLPSGQPDIAP